MPFGKPDLPSADEQEYTICRSIRDVSQNIKDLADTAALISLLDLVISVDTPVTHLAGAMAKRVWTLSPHSACWGYTMNPDSTPWYPSMRLCRHREMCDWAPVIMGMETHLRRLSNEKVGKQA